jgi:hypothetical protein
MATKVIALVAVLDSDTDTLPDDRQIAAALTHSTAADALGTAWGCSVQLLTGIEAHEVSEVLQILRE